MILEAASLYGCLSQINKVRHHIPLLKWVKNTRNSELVVVLGEDIAALLGLLFALIAVVTSVVTRNPVFDAIGSIGIGVLLIFVSLFLGIKIKSLLIGQSSDDETRASILKVLEARPEVDRILRLITLQLGSQVMVAVKAKMKEVDSADQLIDNINTCESELKKENPAIKWIFFEPDNKD
jgi:divalent metal cation (Fe/Co/Zn/Cd) transporter